MERRLAVQLKVSRVPLRGASRFSWSTRSLGAQLGISTVARCGTLQVLINEPDVLVDPDHLPAPENRLKTIYRVCRDRGRWRWVAPQRGTAVDLEPDAVVPERRVPRADGDATSTETTTSTVSAGSCSTVSLVETGEPGGPQEQIRHRDEVVGVCV